MHKVQSSLKCGVKGSCFYKVSSNAHRCWADTAQGGAWLQSDTFGWVGLDSLTDRRMVGRTEEDGEIGDGDIGARC